MFNYFRDDEDEPETRIYVEGCEYHELIDELVNEKKLLIGMHDEIQYRIPELVYRRDIKFCALFDRNITSYLTYLVNNAKPRYPIFKNIAALMAKLQMCNIFSEPGLSYHEYYDNEDFQKVKNDFKSFRIADNLPIQSYIKYLFDENFQFNTEDVHISISEFTEEKISGLFEVFEYNYVTIKKVAILYKKHNNINTALLELLDWLYSDYLITGPALLYAIIYFSPDKINMTSKKLSKKFIRNLTWDLSLLQHYLELVKVQHEKNEIWFLVSNDKILKEAFEIIFLESNRLNFEKTLKSFLNKYWGKNPHISKQIFSKYMDIAQNISNPVRKGIQNKNPEDYFRKLRIELEKEYSNYFSEKGT